MLQLVVKKETNTSLAESPFILPNQKTNNLRNLRNLRFLKN